MVLFKKTRKNEQEIKAFWEYQFEQFNNNKYYQRLTHFKLVTK